MILIPLLCNLLLCCVPFHREVRRVLDNVVRDPVQKKFNTPPLGRVVFNRHGRSSAILICLQLIAARDLTSSNQSAQWYCPPVMLCSWSSSMSTTQSCALYYFFLRATFLFAQNVPRLRKLSGAWFTKYLTIIPKLWSTYYGRSAIFRYSSLAKS